MKLVQRSDYMWHTQTIDEVKRNLNTNIYNGLTEKEVLKRKKKYGLNKLAEKKKESIFSKFISQFKDFMIIILLISALVSALMSYVEKTNDYADSIIIISIVVINAIIGVIQESKAEKENKQSFYCSIYFQIYPAFSV